MELNTEWSFEKPTEEGYYLINSGDVVTDNNLEPVKIFLSNNTLYLQDFQGDVNPLSKIHTSYKFLNISKLGKEIDP